MKDDCRVIFSHSCLAQHRPIRVIKFNWPLWEFEPEPKIAEKGRDLCVTRSKSNGAGRNKYYMYMRKKKDDSGMRFD